VPGFAGERELRDYLTDQRIALARTVRSWLPKTGRTVDVDDIVQQAYVRAFRSTTRLRTRRGAALRAWLFRIARNLVIDDSRRIGRAMLAALDELGGDPSSDGMGGLGDRARGLRERSVVDARDHRDVALRGILVLRRDEQLALVLRDFQAVSWPTATRLLSRPSEKAARNLHLRGRARLTPRTDAIG